MNKILFALTNLLLDLDNSCSIPTNSLYECEVKYGTWMKEAIAI